MDRIDLTLRTARIATQNLPPNIRSQFLASNARRILNCRAMLRRNALGRFQPVRNVPLVFAANAGESALSTRHANCFA